MAKLPSPPGIYTEEILSNNRQIQYAPTSVTAFIGFAALGPIHKPVHICNIDEYSYVFGDLSSPMRYAVRDFFVNGGNHAIIIRLNDHEPEKNKTNPSIEQYLGTEQDGTGIYALKNEYFNFLCITPSIQGNDVDQIIYRQALEFCVVKRAMLLIDPPIAWGTSLTPLNTIKNELAKLDISAITGRNAVLLFPAFLEHGSGSFIVKPSGSVAGLISRMDRNKGFWKFPSGIEAQFYNEGKLQYNINDAEQTILNHSGICCLRNFPGKGKLLWGSRTMAGADNFSDEFKYISIRRTALFIENSIYNGLYWVEAETNDEPLWTKITLLLNNFLNSLFKKGIFQGNTSKEAFFIKCDKETTTQEDINSGIINLLVGFAPLKPFEFIVLRLRQNAKAIIA